MANIKVNNLKTSGIELFDDPESFMKSLNDDEINHIQGGLAAAAAGCCTCKCSCKE